MIQVILTKRQLDMIGEIRGSHVKVGALYLLYRKGSLKAEEAMERIGIALKEAEHLWETLTKEGV